MKFNSKIAELIYRKKYMLEGVDKTLDDPLIRIDKVVSKYYPHLRGKAIEYGNKKWVGFAGGLYRSAMNPNKNISAVNCTTLFPPEDNLESIADSWYWWSKFAAVGQGEGVDLSKLRPKGAIVHNASHTSTGPISFMRTYDAILKEIAQEGRRGASAITLNIKHPDIIDFIKVKDREGILETANISIKITNEFMEAVIEDKEWILEFENKYEKIIKTISAKKLFRLIAEHAYKSGDPGLLFWDTTIKYSNSDVLGEEYKVSGINACSEQPIDSHSICLLSSINLAKFNEYGFDEYERIIRFMIFTLDAFRREEIIMKRSPSNIQLQKLIDMPRIGLGVTGLADYFVRNGITYGSDESIEHTEELFQILVRESYKVSHDIAKEYDKKSFPTYDKEKYKKSAFIKRLLKENIIDESVLDYQAHVCKNSIAPAGSLTFIVEAGGSGVEPIFAKYYVRRERSTTGEWKEWFTFNDLVIQELKHKGIKINKENADKLDTKLWKTAHTIDNNNKLKLMKMIQKYIDSSISITYNLKEDSSIEDIENIYMQAWRNESKGVTVYREGSKTGVMITENNYDKNKNLKRTPHGVIIRPKKISCNIHEMIYGGENYLLLVGMLNDRPYEIFCTKNINKKEFPMNNKKKGCIEKIKKGFYNLVIGNGEKEIYIEDIGSKFDDLYLTLSRFVSMGLRHDIPLQFIVEQLSKNRNFFGFERTVSRVLKKYIKEGEKVASSILCSECGGTEFIYVGGCSQCQSCGYSKCD